ncbi:MAG: DUF1018 domain-containing protein [Magnetococcales bacterium]|nr:DUF1018 domain-containing protein [Magnetococcales bacterium]
MARSRRQALLGGVHIALKNTGLDDDTYRDLLAHTFGVRSSAHLSEADLVRLVIMLQGKAPAPPAPPVADAPAPAPAFKAWPRRPQPRPGNEKLCAKIRACCITLKKEGLTNLPSDRDALEYADATAKRMFYRDKDNIPVRHEWLEHAQLYALAQALETHLRRHGLVYDRRD